MASRAYSASAASSRSHCNRTRFSRWRALLDTTGVRNKSLASSPRLAQVRCGDSQKKRRRLRQRWNSISEKPILFPKKTPPYLNESGAAALADESDYVFYCPLTLVLAFPIFAVAAFALIIDRIFICLHLVRVTRFFSEPHSQFRAPPVWYSITRVSKKLRSFFRSIISLIQGKGFSSCANSGSSPICCARRFAMNLR
jgi:hypothetical protein